MEGRLTCLSAYHKDTDVSSVGLVSALPTLLFLICVRCPTDHILFSPLTDHILFYLALRRDDGIGEWGRLDGDDDQHRARRKAELSQQPVKEGMYRRLGERLGVKLGHLAGHYETAFSPAGGEEKRPRRRYVKVVEG